MKKATNNIRDRFDLAAAIAFMLLWMPASVQGQEFSGFLDGYSELTALGDRILVYENPKGIDALTNYDAVMIDQPEIAVAADSKYQSMKPDDMKLISDSLRTVLVRQLERSKYRLVTTVGPNTLYLRTAITDLHLEKKGKRIFHFTPVGVVATLVSTPFKDVMDKINLQKVTFEAELLDSQSEERLGAYVEKGGSATEKKEETSWDELIEQLDLTAARLACRLNNGALAAEDRINCLVEHPF